MTPTADIGLIGLAVMGQNLVLNMNDHGFVVCVYNRTASKVDEFLDKEAKGTKIIGAKSLEDLVSSLKSPRRVMLLVKAGRAVDEFVDKLIPLLDKGDIIIDGGNSDYKDTQRRCKSLEQKGLFFVGSGVSGGEEGARYGPSLMPGGSKQAWPHLKPIFQAIAAKVGIKKDEPCCDWVGNDGAGHFVKMVHNGIEYGDMQLICEAYHLMKDVLHLDHDEMSEIFHKWNTKELESFLIEITADILKFKDLETGQALVNQINDSAGQKGTGKWTGICALDLGVPVTLIAQAVFARCLSSLKQERMEASKILPKSKETSVKLDKIKFLDQINKALYAAKIISYAQGFMLMQSAAHEYGWTLNYGNIAMMWRGGCIIRSVFLGRIKDAFEKMPNLKNLLLDDFFRQALKDCQIALREINAVAAENGIPIPAIRASLNFFDGYRCAVLPANLLQALRDYFGSHTYERIDSLGHFVHTDWHGEGRHQPSKKALSNASESSTHADIGLIGLAVMGQNLVLNMNDHGFVVCVYNRTVSKVDQFLANEAKGTKVQGAKSLEELVSKLKTPRRIMLLVKAGSAVDEFIDRLSKLLENGDIIIDGGNSDYRDTQRRCKDLREKGLLFVGSGVSGGEDGARYGPSLMPGGSVEAWPPLKPIFQAIAAKVGPNQSEPCCDWVGDNGAGHFVKMVHNGIEYGDMQLICEAYHLMKDVLNISHEEMSKIFKTWNSKELESYLIEITADVLKTIDEKTGEPLVTQINDSAGQKGTGKWTGICALDMGVPVTLIAEAVFARCLSSLKRERVEASKLLPKLDGVLPKMDKSEFLHQINQALYAAKIISYAQGFMLMQAAAKQYDWNLNYGSIAMMWRGGCIIRSVFLGRIKDAFDKTPDLKSLLLDEFFRRAFKDCQDSLRKVVSIAGRCGIPIPAFSAALDFYDGYRCAVLPANLIQAQRDYFGAHTYERLDKPGQFVHTNWTGRGGRVASSTYQA